MITVNGENMVAKIVDRKREKKREGEKKNWGGKEEI